MPVDAAPRALLDRFADSLSKDYAAKRSILSFDEYLDDVYAHPRRHIRNAARYMMDVVEHFGDEEVKLPTGKFTRWKLFDLAFDDGKGRVAGQERVQNAIVRVLENFVRAGRVDRLILLHGPNGSAKTSLIQALTRAAEVYSQHEDGALYRFNWVFPTGQVAKGKLGFGGESSKTSGTYAHLEPGNVEARVPCEFKDHPLLLLPREHRAALFDELKKNDRLPHDWTIPDVLKTGDLSVKNRKIFDALMTHTHGDVREVLRHVQVERFYLSRRYRSGVVAVEPQMSVDAYSRQITADRSIGMLPVALQHLALFETGGAINDANRGVLEFNDLLKRPLDAWKYLLVATEQAQASLEFVSVFLDVVMIASSNELHLDAFKQHPDWPSFKGRMELVTAPYLLRVADEIKIYEDQIPRALTGVHIAPHALEVAARWAVLTRLEPPDPDAYPADVKKLVEDLSPVEKMRLYDDGRVPERLSQKDRKELRQVADLLYDEYAARDEYEGRYGASAREVRTVLLNAAQNASFDHLSPIAIFDELRTLVRAKSTYEWLRREPVRGYRDPHEFVNIVEEMYVRDIDEEVRTAMGLVKAGSHVELFERYIRNVSAWTKKEKLADPVTGKLVDADADMMKRVEDVLLTPQESPDDFRRSIIGQIGAYKLEHPEDKVDYELLFGGYMKRLNEDFYNQRKKAVLRLEQAFLKVLDGEDKDVDAKEREQVDAFRKNLHALGYNDASARSAIAFMMKRR
jgi:predicted Ser/Thr protein kinase